MLFIVWTKTADTLIKTTSVVFHIIMKPVQGLEQDEGE